MRLFIALVTIFVSCLTQAQGIRDGAFITRSSTLLRGLCGYWRLEEASGLRYDSSQYGSHLTSNNTVGQTTGLFGNCATFTDANTRYLSIADNAALSLGANTDFTISGWMKLNSTAESRQLVVKRTASGASTEYYVGYIQGNNAFRFVIGNGVSAGPSLVNTAPTTGVWYHVMAWYDSANQLIFLQVNGVVQSASWTGGTFDGGGEFRIGSDPIDAAAYMDGSIDEVAFWKRKLTARERSDVYMGGYFPRFQNTTNAVWVEMASLPEPKEQHGFEECGGLLYVVAGVTTGDVHTDNVYAYNPGSDSWSQKADYPLAIQSPCLRSVSGKLYGFGGYDSTIPTKYTNVYEYSPSANTWTAKTGMPVALEDMASAVISNKVYIVGGLINPGASHVINSIIQVYDPSNDTWTTNYTVMPNPRALGDFGTSDGTNFFLVSGTADMSAYPTTLNASTRTDIYDPGTDTWTQKANIGTACCYKEVAVIGPYLYSMSGATVNLTTYTTANQRYDIAGNSWATKTAVPYSARGLSTCVLNNMLYVSGGYNGAYMTNHYRYNPAADP